MRFSCPFVGDYTLQQLQDMVAVRANHLVGCKEDNT